MRFYFWIAANFTRLTNQFTISYRVSRGYVRVLLIRIVLVIILAGFGYPLWICFNIPAPVFFSSFDSMRQICSVSIIRSDFFNLGVAASSRIIFGTFLALAEQPVSHLRVGVEIRPSLGKPTLEARLRIRKGHCPDQFLPSAVAGGRRASRCPFSVRQSRSPRFPRPSAFARPSRTHGT